MKKLLSVLVIVAMLVTSIAPVLVVSAAGTGVAVASADITRYIDTSAEMTDLATVSLEQNPGVSTLHLLVYYDYNQVDISDVTPAAAYSDITSVSLNRRSTASAVKNFFTAAGITPATNIRCADVTIENPDDDFTSVGELFKANFIVRADLSKATEGVSYDWGIIVAEALNVAGDEVEVVNSHIQYKYNLNIDPYAPVIKEKTLTDAFTFCLDDVDVAEGATTVPLRFYSVNNEANNPVGYWGGRWFLYYSTELKIESYKNGVVFADSEMNVVAETLNTAISAAPKELQDAFGEKGVTDYLTQDWYYTVFTYASELHTAQVKSDGVILTFTFKLPENAKSGKSYKIGIAANSWDIVNYMTKEEAGGIENTYVPFKLSDGSITIIGDCSHDSTHEVIVTEPTCTTAGSKNIVCDACKAVIDTVEIPALGHNAGERVITVQPTYEAEGHYEIRCTRCNEIIEEGSVPALTKVSISVPSATARYGTAVTLPIKLAKNDGIFMAVLDVDFDATKLQLDSVDCGDVFSEKNDRVILNTADAANGKATLVFEAGADADITADGTLAYLNFTVIDDATLAGEAVAVNVSYKDANLINYAGDKIAADIDNATVTVEDWLKLVAEDASTEIGNDSVSIPVTGTAGLNFWAIRAEFSYDSNAFEFQGIESGILNVSAAENYSEKDGVITLFYDNADMANIDGNGTLFTIKLKPIMAAAGTYGIDFTLIDLITIDGANQAANTRVFDSTVTVAECSHPEDLRSTVINVEPTIDSEGQASIICGKCNEVIDTYVIPALMAVRVAEVTEAVAEGETVTVPVTITSNSGVYSIGATFAYDASALTFAGITDGLFTVDDTCYSVKDGVVTVFVENSTLTDITENGVAFNLVFTVNEGTANGTYAIAADKVEGNTVSAATETKVDIVPVDGFVTVFTPETVFITKAVAKEKISTIALDGESISITSKEGAEYVKFAVGKAAGSVISAIDGATIVEAKSEYAVISMTGSAATFTVTAENGKTKTYTVAVTYAPDAAAITAYGAGYNAESVLLTDTAFTVTAKSGVSAMTFYIQTIGSVTAEGLEVVKSGSTYYLKSTAANAEATITVTMPSGRTYEYTVSAIYSGDFIAASGVGFKTDSIAADGNAFTVTAGEGMYNATFYIDLAEGATLESSTIAIAATHGNRLYFKANINDADAYSIVVKNVAGQTETYTVNVVWNYSDVESIIPGRMATGATIVGTDIQLAADASAAYVSFRFKFSNNNMTLACDNANVEIVKVGGIHYFKIANDGTGSATATITATNSVSGVVTVYTVNAYFG